MDPVKNKIHHGIDVPITALHSKQSCGIGEYYDLYPLVDWCHQHKMDVLMLLPLNETAATDPSPYNAISSCALHPLYLSLGRLPYLEKNPDLVDQLSEFKTLNATKYVQYREVYDKKFVWLRKYFERIKSVLLKDLSFQSFQESQKSWLVPYALFKILKLQYNHAAWMRWDSDHKSPSPQFWETLTETHREEMNFHFAMQFLCFEQLKQVKSYANARGILVKGDIPLLLSLDSADVWAEPQFFDLTMGAGAPPDDFNRKGQAWGFPLYRWDVMRQDAFSWWKRRIAYAAHFYDAFRIDHIVGFFHIWGIPLNKLPKEGHYEPQDASQWIPQGTQILESILSFSHMIPIGEDLGNVPNEVRECLHSLGICTTMIVRWARKNGVYIPYKEYPVLSMTSVSTHDIETLAGWWKKFPDEAKAFAGFKHWNYSPTLSFDQHKELLRDSHHTSSLFHINLLQEYLALFPELVWQTPEEERINVPGTFSPTNWTYRYRCSLEEIVAHTQLSEAMEEVLRGG